MKIIVSDLVCPKCGSPEEHPSDKDAILIRGFKVLDKGHWWSECLVCSGYYDKDLVPKPRKPGERYPEGYKAFWF